MLNLPAIAKQYGPLFIGVAILAFVIWLIYYAGKKQGTGNVTVTDDQGNIVNPTPAQQQQANTIATRIHTDLNSGWLGGYNIWGNIGRDTQAYQEFAGMSDAMFSFTAQTYKTLFGSSIIADITAETSLPNDNTLGTKTPKYLILEKANRLNIV
jgi:hypothetical protein